MFHPAWPLRSLRRSPVPQSRLIPGTWRHARRYAEQHDGTHELFNYSSGRWLYNEQRRLDERHLEFNIDALKRAAAESVHMDVRDVTSITKFAEGGFNRLFHITMKYGLEVVARLPYNMTQPRKLATASEVATMAWLRIQGFPVPCVYGYSAESTNPVGSEYIIMEKAVGEPLTNKWFDLSDKQRIKLLASIVELETKLFKLEYPAHGSVFYTRDIPPNMDRIHLAGSFSVGPDVGMANWLEKRSAMAIRRGPANSALEVLQQAAQREIAYLRQFGRHRYPFDRAYRDITNFAKSDPTDHLRNLQRFLKVSPHLVPSEDWLTKPTLRHPDLSPNNIFVSEDMKVTCMIDWQHAAIRPLFLAAAIPSNFANYGDPDSEALNKPQLPVLKGLDETERDNELELYRRRHVHFCYLGATAEMNRQHYNAIMNNRTMFIQRMYRYVRVPWEGNSIPLQAVLVRLMKSWRDIVPDQTASDCPISFTDEEADSTLQALGKQMETNKQMSIIQNMLLGCGNDGWVSSEEYDRAKQAAVDMKKEAIEQADDQGELDEIVKGWPFDDHDEDE